jgi:hypothetical protein
MFEGAWLYICQQYKLCRCKHTQQHRSHKNYMNINKTKPSLKTSRSKTPNLQGHTVPKVLLPRLHAWGWLRSSRSSSRAPNQQPQDTVSQTPPPCTAFVTLVAPFLRTAGAAQLSARIE